MNNSEKLTKPHFALLFFSLLLIFLIPFVSVAVIVFALPPVYDETFVGELGEKYELLNSTDEPKIVFVGGSSLAFGLDSDMVKEELPFTPVNMGLYANLGTKIMLDLSSSNINEGDIIVIAPEMNSQTLSLYFNGETTMQALDGSPEMLKSIGSDDYTSLVGELWNFATRKLSYTVSGERPENTGAYKKEHFNKYGDNDFDRPYNVMTTVQKSITLDFRYDKNDGVTTEYELFIDYLNDFVDDARDKGATVYFSFPPMNSAAMSNYNTKENITEFYNNLARSLHCRIISNINDYIMDEGYFFDSEFHLNNDGVVVRTVKLIDDIKRQLGRTDVTMSSSDLPTPPGYKPQDFTGGEVENLYFELELAKNGAGQDVWYIKGLNEEGRKQLMLTVPNVTEGLPVVGIMPYAFADSEVRTLTLGDNVSFMMSKALSGATNLSALYISKSDPGEISVPNKGDESGLAIDETNAKLKIYLPPEAIEVYKADYFWSDYSTHFLPNPTLQ